MFGGLGVGELRRVKQLEDENRKLKQLFAVLMASTSFSATSRRTKPDKARTYSTRQLFGIHP